MKKRNILPILVFIILLLPSSVSALCSNNEKVRLASLARNISVTYDPIETETGVTFDITFTNLQPELYIKDVTYQYKHYYNENELTLHGYSPNTNYRFDIYGHGDCNIKLYSHYLTTPGYNPYYKDKVCEEFSASICQKWVNINYNYDTFILEVNKLKANQKENVKSNNDEKIMGIYDYLIEFFVNYYFIILPVIIVVCITLIIQLRKKDDLF